MRAWWHWRSVRRLRAAAWLWGTSVPYRNPCGYNPSGVEVPAGHVRLPL